MEQNKVLSKKFRQWHNETKTTGHSGLFTCIFLLFCSWSRYCVAGAAPAGLGSPGVGIGGRDTRPGGEWGQDGARPGQATISCCRTGAPGMRLKASDGHTQGLVKGIMATRVLRSSRPCHSLPHRHFPRPQAMDWGPWQGLGTESRPGVCRSCRSFTGCLLRHNDVNTEARLCYMSVYYIQ